jgi:hypothetical protein
MKLPKKYPPYFNYNTRSLEKYYLFRDFIVIPNDPMVRYRLDHGCHYSYAFYMIIDKGALKFIGWMY